MYDLRIFNNEEYGQVSVIIENNKEYFEATKIANTCIKIQIMQ